jgi:hypothetical protein
MLKSNKLFFTSFLICLFAGLLLLILNKFLDGNAIWVGKLGNGGQYAEYCELNQFSKFLRQPMNSYSNLAFLFFGISVIGLGLSDYKNKKTGNPLYAFSSYSILQGIYFCYLFLGSTYYHASLTWTAQRVDMNATYALTLGLLGYAVFRNLLSFSKQEKYLQIVVIAALLILNYLFIYIHLLISSSILLPFLFLLVGIQIAFFLYKNTKQFNTQFLILSIVSMIVAIVVRTLDVKKIGCDPLSIFQGHALWHLLTGMGGYFMYLFYRSEKFPK